MTARVLPLMLIILTLGLGTVQAEAIDIVDNHGGRGRPSCSLLPRAASWHACYWRTDEEDRWNARIARCRSASF